METPTCIEIPTVPVPSPEDSSFTLKNIHSALKDLVDWKPLAIQLEMSATKIEEIDVNNRGRVADCRYSMIQFWLQSDISRSWQKLIGALKSTDYSVLAEEIKSTYCPMFQGAKESAKEATRELECGNGRGAKESAKEATRELECGNGPGAKESAKEATRELECGNGPGFTNIPLPSNKDMFAESVTSALNYLKHCCPHQLQCDVKLIVYLCDQLVNGFITVSFIGEYNSGKSALINAVLGNSYLQENFEAATINQVFIEHDSNVHLNSSCDKKCEACPKLSYFPPKADGSFLALGQSNILEQIQRSNSEQRHTDQCSQTSMENFLLKVNTPFLENISKRSKMKVYLVDNPGFGETNRQAQRTAQDAMANSSIYVVCMDYEHTEGTKQFIRHFLSKMDDKFCLTRLLIVITKCDRWQPGKSKCTDIFTSLKQSICEKLNKFIQSTDGIEDVPGGQKKSVVTIPIDNVIAVSAKWEQQAAQYDATAIMESHSLTNMSLDEGTKMKALSNIERLKDMIQHAVDRSYECWVNQMKQGVTEILSCASKALHQDIDNTENEVKRVNSEMQDLSERKRLFDAQQLDIRLHEEKFRCAYDQDIKNHLDPLSEQFDRFFATSLEKVKITKYTRVGFEEAVDHFMEMFISMANQRMDDATFVTLNDEYSKAFCAVQQWYTQRTDAANYFCTGSVTSSSIDYVITRPVGTVREAPNYLELRNQLNIPPVELSLFEKLLEYFRVHFSRIFNPEGFSPEHFHTLKPVHIEAVMKDLWDLVKCKYEKNDEIVQLFCESLKMVYESKEQQLHTLWGDKVKEKEKHLEKLENERYSLQEKLQQLKSCIDKIEAYKEDVVSKAKNALEI